ncbi:MAG: TIGR03617 family F420-dependent LLM class oxidoreductase [Gemmatimonadetes bacterium]|nr:TIGR03617 family F420-dependent LLM class oxidoreductase [Gemmatimonadota bacterium]
MKFDLYLYHPRQDEMAERVRQAEAGGFDGLFVAESTADPFQCLAVAAASRGSSFRASSLDLGTSVALAFPRSPMVTAVAAWDLQRATGGGFVLGLGSQVRRHVERRFSAPFAPAAARLREYAQAVRHVWGAFQGTHPLSFSGSYYQLDYLPDAVNPGPLDSGPPLLYLAALGTQMFEAAGAVADGALVHPIHTLEYLRTVAEPAIARGQGEAGRSRAGFGLSVTVLCIVESASGVEAGPASREAVRRQIAFYASTPAYRPVLELHGWGALGDKLRGLVRSGDAAAMGAVVPDEVLDEFCVIAPTWDEAVVRARQRYEGVADRVMFQSAPPLSVG